MNQFLAASFSVVNAEVLCEIRNTIAKQSQSLVLLKSRNARTMRVLNFFIFLLEISITTVRLSSPFFFFPASAVVGLPTVNA
jgi:hypothetical protein